MSNTQVKVNLQIFPLPIVESALYVLSERLDGRIGELEDGQIAVSLTALEVELDVVEMEHAFNRALIAASVNEHAFQRSASIRNYLAQTAFSITTQNQQTIEEFAASMADRWPEEHAGAPSAHLHGPPPDDDRFTATEIGNRWLVDEEEGRIILQLDTHRFLLPDALWAANEMADTCGCTIDNLPGNQLIVVLELSAGGAEPVALVEEFEHWLVIAQEHCR